MTRAIAAGVVAGVTAFGATIALGGGLPVALALYAVGGAAGVVLAAVAMSPGARPRAELRPKALENPITADADGRRGLLPA